jgi:DNA-binding transcriptional LysR family regulator
VASFSAANPEWNIRIDATPDFSAFDTEAVDLDLRYGMGAWTGLSVDCVMQDYVLPMCSPRYLERLRELSSDPVEQLQNAKLIDSVKTFYRWDIWLASNRLIVPDVSYPFRFDRSSMSIEMAKQGGGIALDSAMLCLGDLQRGDLVPFSLAHEVIRFPAYWIVCPPRHLSRRIVNRFTDWVIAEASRHEADTLETLTQSGCRFRDVDLKDLTDVTPWSL